MRLRRLLFRIGLTSPLLAALYCLVNREVSVYTVRQHDAYNNLVERRQLAYGRQGLRYAVFGSSIAWGAGLDSRYEAYPYELSPKVDNYATYSGGPNYPAVCTQTLVGNKKAYDVVLIDYYLLAPEGVAYLAKKIRSRFPAAIIIFVKIWTPNMLRRKLPDGSGYETLQAFQDRLLTKSFELGSKDIITALQNDNAQWIFPPHKPEDAVIQDAADEVNGHVFEMDDCNGDAKQFLINYLDWFDNSDSHSLLSQLGHDAIATDIQSLVNSVSASASSGVAIQTSTLGDWDRGDHCNLWYTSGHCELTYSDNYEVVLYDDWLGKYAMEIDGPGWINVTNPFSDPRHLYLSFVSTSKPGVYPKISLPTFYDLEMDPVNTTYKFRNGVDTPYTMAVGVVEPGVTTIEITPLETTSKPFRLVGFAISNEEAVPDPWKFTPPFNN